MTTTTTTAIRTRKSNGATIVVTLADGRTLARGGKIAERATCVLVAVDLGGRPFVFGFRTDLAAATALVARSGNPDFEVVRITEEN